MYEPILILGDRRISGYDWDDANRRKCQKHGVTIETIERSFALPFFILDDPDHSGSERRYKAIIKDENGRGLLIAFTLRQRGEETLIRPISVRHMHRKEIDYYEKEAEAATRPPQR